VVEDGIRCSKQLEISYPVTTIFQKIDFNFINDIVGINNRGRKGYTPKVLFCCILLMFLQQIPSIRRLILKLKNDKELAKAIGLPKKSKK
jgi:transposase